MTTRNYHVGYGAEWHGRAVSCQRTSQPPHGGRSRLVPALLLLTAGLLSANPAAADTITILATSAQTVTGWDFEPRALAPIDACDANHTALQRDAFSPNNAFLTFTAFQAYATPARQQISSVMIDFLGGSDAGTGQSGFEAQVSGKAGNSVITWNEDVLDCQWRFRNTAGGGGFGWPITGLFTSWNDATVAGLNIRVRRAGAGSHDLRINGARIVVLTVPQIPQPPSGLILTGTTTNSTSMAWGLSSLGGVPTSVEVERATGAPSNGYALIATLAGDATDYVDTGLAERTTYYYRVRAINGTGASGYSNESFGTTLNSIHHLVFSVQPPSSIPASNDIGAPGGVQVTGVDASGFVVPTFTGSISLSLGSPGCGGPLLGTTSKNAVSGVASFSNLRLHQVCASQTLVATASGIPNPTVTSSSFAIVAAAADHIQLLSQPTDVVVEQPMAPFQVEIVDVFGNRITSLPWSNVNMYIDIQVGPQGGGIVGGAGSTQTLSSSGVGTFSGVRLDRVGGYRLMVIADAIGGGQAVTDSFNVSTVATAPQYRVDIVGPSLMRANYRTAFDLVVENQGNTAGTCVPLWLAGIPAGTVVETDTTLAAVAQDAGEPAWSQAPVTLNGAGGQYLSLVIPSVPPGSQFFRIYLTPPLTVTTMTLHAGLTPSWADNVGSLQTCLSDAGVLLTQPCLGIQLSAIAAYVAAHPEARAFNGVGVWAKQAWNCEGASSLGAALAKAEQVLDVLAAPVEQSAALPARCELAAGPRWRSDLVTTVVGAVDPNDKFGATGAVSVQQPLPYSIRFENLASAGAPAAIVEVVDHLNLSTMDVGTVSLGPITFGSRRIVPSPGRQSGLWKVDLRPNKNILVKVSAALTPGTGVLNWKLESLDPVTELPIPINPPNGFLPPNVVPPEGEGSVVFTVRSRSDLPAGTQISNQASVKFDANSTMLTPFWLNTMDNVPPSSHVLPLSGAQDSTTFSVHWEATGSPPDLRDFTLYVSDEGGPYGAWLIDTPATAARFPGQPGHYYEFFSLARDLSGNVELPPDTPRITTTPDAQTYVPAPGVSVATGRPFRLALEGARPNPAQGDVQASFELPDDKPAALELLDVGGRRVLRREVGLLGAGRHALALPVPGKLGPGIYWLRLTRLGERRVSKVVVVR